MSRFCQICVLRPVTQCVCVCNLHPTPKPEYEWNPSFFRLGVKSCMDHVAEQMKLETWCDIDMICKRQFFGAIFLDSPGLPPDWTSTKKVCCGDSIWDSQFQWVIITFPSADILKKKAKINWSEAPLWSTATALNLSNASSTGATI